MTEMRTSAQIIHVGETSYSFSEVEEKIPVRTQFAKQKKRMFYVSFAARAAN